MTEKKSKKRPKGRDEVVEALIKSAAKLFAERGIAGVSLREIAAQAGVNHQYWFGVKALENINCVNTSVYFDEQNFLHDADIEPKGNF